MDFDFATSKRIIFGTGKLHTLATILTNVKASNVLFIQKKGLEAVETVHQLLNNQKIQYFDFAVSGEPDVDRIDQISSIARKNHCDLVIGLGGGSVIDTGKAVSAMASNSGDLLDYLEVVGKGKPLEKPALPYIAIPTTAGTGSEVTKNAVISVKNKNVKVSMRDNSMIPMVALVDPELTYQVPDTVTAYTGMDAFTQVIEPYVCNSPNSFVDMFCRDAIPRAGKFLYRAYTDGTDREARINMAWVSLMGGLSLANAKLGAVHGLAGPMGGMFNIPHGLICAILLPAVMRINLDILKQQNQNKNAMSRFKDIAEWITQDPSAGAEDGLEQISALCNKLNIPRLSHMSIQEADFEIIAAKSINSSSMKGNPVKLEMENILQILEQSY